jgi:hypothetical protein
MLPRDVARSRITQFRDERNVSRARPHRSLPGMLRCSRVWIASFAVLCACNGAIKEEGVGSGSSRSESASDVSSGSSGSDNGTPTAPDLRPVGGSGSITLFGEAPLDAASITYEVNANFDYSIPTHDGVCALQTIGSCSFDPCVSAELPFPSAGGVDAPWPNPGTIVVSGATMSTATLTPLPNGQYQEVHGGMKPWQGGEPIVFQWAASPPNGDGFAASSSLLTAPSYATIAAGSAFSDSTTPLKSDADITVAWTMDGQANAADNIMLSLFASSNVPQSAGTVLSCSFDPSARHGVISADLLALVPRGSVHFDLMSTHRLDVTSAGDTPGALWQVSIVVASHVRNGSGLVIGSTTIE